MLRFIAADLRRHLAGVLAILAIVALATALGVAVTLQERTLRLGSARAADAFDLVIGAPGAETQLVLSSVFLQAAPLPLMRGSVLAGLLADPRVAWAAPIGFGDEVEGLPIVGTSPALIAGLGGVTEGSVFARLDEAVIGAAVPFRIGDRFRPMHGHASEGGEVHAGVSCEVVGRLKPTGTPWDRAVLVPIEAVWRLHAHAATEHAQKDGPQAAHDPAGHDEARPDEVAHGAGDPAFHVPLDPAALADPGAPGLPAILVKPRSVADAYRLRQSYRGETTLAVFPAEVLTRLYGVLGDARLVLGAVAYGAQALVGAAILIAILVHVLQRRRQIGALRAFGAPRLAVLAIVWGEVFLVLGLGLLAGIGLGYVAAQVLSSHVAGATGVPMPVGFVREDVLPLAGLLLAGALIALVPAVLAYRQSPAAALR
ncbi:FtsX-like permease family protein [Ancylobacter sp. 6x-1]|uniref:FtsX-like permease family protein n=1 Tax=Ancylobacter crimeensis TaxID=2579147 RepID=A0ABT0DAE5_9HYPH|nr:FtsX-like permease family protein [Ancylobacter crimeensis]MCK0196938.1 FtsX-like permease family protein [Ancylobacter crimeensis]